MWLDSRPNEFPSQLPDGTVKLAPAMPELMVDEAPPKTAFVVMTHSHGLDQEICEAVLRRGDYAYLGLIGSDTKAARFASRLRARGLGDADLARLHCPIGLPGITGKAPSVIAASVAADLLMRLEQAAPSVEFDSVIGGSLDV
jgi:xanthine dehydrogenase accessory factor